MTPESFVYRGAKIHLKIFEEYKDSQKKNKEIKEEIDKFYP